MKFRKIKTALIGCGMISDIYLENLSKLDIIDLVGCSDIIPSRSKDKAEKYGITQMTNDEIFSDTEIELVVNTTYPMSHYEIAKKALLSGKSVYTEKMICSTLSQVNELCSLAEQKNLFFGGAPETYFGGAFQLARNIIDIGIIGQPVMAEAFLSRSYHHERYYIGDEKRFAFSPGGGIIFDMGAYYLTVLVFLLGTVTHVKGFSRIYEPDRIYMNPKSPNFGKSMTVESDNISTASLLFENGTMGNITMLSESAPQNHFHIYCTDGYIDLGDPNCYHGTLKLVNKKGLESTIEAPFGFDKGNFRGYGAAEAMYAKLDGRKARCNGELCRHVLEIALGIIESSKNNNSYIMTTKAERPKPFRTGQTENTELALRFI